MHFSTVTTIFGLVAVTIAAPAAPSGGPPGGVTYGHHQGSESVCFCCPSDENDPESGNCSRLAEDNTC
ncbi:hypothetical protein PENSUB_6700 [Penicillium subrubescens]|uniref:Uncharacterized protein n=1 Tax=Penicillium subrubescens TaxID=1316194 RepID=A0A1Q5TXI2_9EURO|nr:hypothetical protein PENSUB_6700 [Penicillium subrubescens]